MQRAFACGIVLIVALAHDFVLRRNCRIAFAGDHPDSFSESTHGSHHVHLVGHIAALWNSLLVSEKGKEVGRKQMEPLPLLPAVESGETFGLVQSNYNTSFKGLIAIKEEPEDDNIKNIPLLDDADIQNLMHRLKINPADVQLLQPPPQSSPSSTILMPHRRDTLLMSHQHEIMTVSPGPSSTQARVTANDGDLPLEIEGPLNINPADSPRHKRKASSPGGANPSNEAGIANKKARIQQEIQSADTVVTSPHSQNRGLTHNASGHRLPLPY